MTTTRELLRIDKSSRVKSRRQCIMLGRRVAMAQPQIQGSPVVGSAEMPWKIAQKARRIVHGKLRHYAQRRRTRGPEALDASCASTAAEDASFWPTSCWPPCFAATLCRRCISGSLGAAVNGQRRCRVVCRRQSGASIEKVRRNFYNQYFQVSRQATGPHCEQKMKVCMSERRSNASIG
jgi:hypothetical protein